MGALACYSMTGGCNIKKKRAFDVHTYIKQLELEVTECLLFMYYQEWKRKKQELLDSLISCKQQFTVPSRLL